MPEQYIETERIRQDGYYDVRCPQCGKWFEAARSSATFCNSTCRSRWSRSAASRVRQIDNARSAVASLIETMPKRGDSAEYLALQKLASIIKNALMSVEN